MVKWGGKDQHASYETDYLLQQLCFKIMNQLTFKVYE